MTTRTIPLISIESRHAAQDGLGYLGELYVDGPRIFACGGTYGRSTLLVSIDGGKTFERRPTPRTPGLRRIARDGDHLVLTGEYGTLALSDDMGLTWLPLPLPTATCLFDFAVDREGQRIVIGDDGFLARAPKGSWDFTVVESGTDTRQLSFGHVGERLFVLGYDGTLREWNGKGLDEAILDCGKALTALAVTPSGAWLLTSDGGGIFRSDDGGKTFAQVPSPVEEDLEHVYADARGVFAVGNESTLLFSDDDGKTFVSVPNDGQGHLWCIAPVGGSYLVSGDDGEIFAMSVSSTETMTVDLTPAKAADEDEDDEDEEDEEEDEAEEEEASDEDEEVKGAAAPVAFASVEEASSRWTREGKAFMSALNGYLDRIYSVGINKAGKEPTDTREDMADYVRERLVELNAKGEHAKARALFPPAYEPFDYEPLGRSVSQVARLLDGRILVQVANDVHVLERDKIGAALDGVLFFALSPDRRLVGLGYEDRMDVHEGLGGKKVRSLPFPDGVGGGGNTAQLTPEGDGCLITTDGGVLWVGERGIKPLMPDSLEADAPHYLHGAMSPNGRFVAIGCQDSSHILIDRKTGSRKTYNTVSSYPHFAFFHRDRPEVVFNSVHGMYGSGSLAVSLDAMLAGKSDSARILDRRAWVFSGASLGDGWLLGDRGGYVWCLDGDGEQKWYLFLGSSLTAMDVSPDEKTLLVGSIAGFVIEIDLTATARDPMLLTNGNVKEAARWVFWNGHDPMIW